MHVNQAEFLKYLEAEDKEACVNFAVEKLHQKGFQLQELYEGILGPALNQINSCDQQDHDCIWKEHLKTSIVRTVVECCYPFVIHQRKQLSILGIKVLILCPENELHEIGARMAADFFTLNGYEAIFIGSNTPRDQIKSAILAEKPKYVAISVTDYYNIVAAKKTIELVRETCQGDVLILVGGNAFRTHQALITQVGADIYIESYDDIRRLGEGDRGHETSV